MEQLLFVIKMLGIDTAKDFRQLDDFGYKLNGITKEDIYFIKDVRDNILYRLKKNKNGFKPE